MKAIVLSKSNNIYKVELKPDFIERLFGNKKEIIEFKKTDDTYTNFKGFYAVIRKDGSLLPYSSVIVKVINYYDDAF